MNRPLACPVIDSPDAAPLPFQFSSNHAERSPPPILLANAVSKPAADGSSQHGSARIGNERESWRPARDRIARGALQRLAIGLKWPKGKWLGRQPLAENQ